MRPSEEDLREIAGQIAKQRRLRCKVAVEAGVHPTRFSAMLSGRLPMPPRVYDATCSVLQIVRGGSEVG
jgi:hypothetical protein